MDPEQIPLRDLHLPEAIGWWPLAYGWWVLIALALAGLAYLVHRVWRRWRANRPRRIALQQLKKVQADYRRGVDAVSLSKQLSQLLRRAMLAYAPRDEVAGLTGQRWLEWLDRGMQGQPFTTGPGRMIGSLPYLRLDEKNSEVNVAVLIDTVRERLQRPLPEARH
jgi:Domain of unknown function (DUF4381)